MKQKTYFFPLFLVSLAFALLLFFVGRFGILGFVQSSIQQAFFPLDAVVFSALHGTRLQTDQLSLLQSENATLREQLSQMQALKEDNAALRDQFQTTSPSSLHLLPARVVGMPNVIPNVSFPETLIIDKGSKDNVRKGQVVVVKNIVVGQVTSTTSHFAVVTLVSARSSSFPAQTATTQAIGVLNGQGNGELILNNVVLSDALKENDTVVTKGSQDASGNGYPPDLVVGKIVGIDKNPSNLFQTARVDSLLQFDHLTTVFLLVQ